MTQNRMYSLPDDVYDMLVEMAEEDERTKSNMLAWLVIQENKRRNPPEPEPEPEQAS